MDLGRDLIQSWSGELGECKQIAPRQEERSVRRRKWQRRRLRKPMSADATSSCHQTDIMTNQEVVTGCCCSSSSAASSGSQEKATCGTKRHTRIGKSISKCKSIPYMASLVLLALLGLQLFHLSGDNFNRENGNDNYRVPSCLAQAHELTSQDALETNRKTSATFSTSNQNRHHSQAGREQVQQVSAEPRSARDKRSTHTASGCPYPAVGANCQMSIVAQAPAVPLLSTEYVADEYASLKADTQASYKCDQGYELLGQESLTCLPSGRWSAPPPSCVTNIALGKPTNQSSTLKGGDSRNANDGRFITQHDSKFCTETRVEQSPWWQVDLLQLYEIRSVRLLGRACCNPQLSLHDIEIRVGNSSSLQGNRLCAWYPNNLEEGTAKDFQCAHPIVGRFVSIQMVGIEAALSLCEVMILSTKEFPAERCAIQTTLAPSNRQQTTTTTSATTTLTSLGGAASADNQVIVFNRTCYEMQTTNGGSFLVADTYCKARGGSLLHSVNNLTQSFISHELERLRGKLKSKMVWLGAKREVSSSNALGPIMSGSTSALIADNSFSLFSPEKRLSASLDESPSESLFSSEHGLSSSGESSPLFSPTSAARTSLFQVSTGAGGSTSRGSQTFGLQIPSQHLNPNRSAEHMQRSLIISQPNQVASFFSPPVPSGPGTNQPVSSVSSSTVPSSGAINFNAASHVHRSLRPPSLLQISTPTPSSAPSSASSQTSWVIAPTSSQNSGWRWVGDAPSETLQSPINSFLWADDQPNNYNNQQDCIVLDGAKKWLWNDVTCELDYLPWVCQYRPTGCGSPDRNENSTVLELPSSTETSSTIEGPYQLGKSITYACPVGHRLDGSRQRKCQYDGTWSGKAPKCQYVDCGPINTQIENGRLIHLNQSQTTFGSQVKYVCYEDYVLVGTDSRQCQADGKWSGKAPYCAYKWCPVLQQISHGYLNVSSYSENSIATYQCNSGYKLIGNDTRQCLLGGKWTNQEPFCQYVDCGQPKQLANGNYQLVNSTTNYLSVVLYSCNENYTLVGTNNKMICSHNNRWTGKDPQCSLIDCGQPQANQGSSFSGESFTVHSKVEYKCDSGFKEVGGNAERTCGLDGQWTGHPIACKYVDCGRVTAILKGEVSYINGTTYLASQVAYDCTPGNRLSGHRVRFCGPDGRWTGSSPKCEEVRCDAPRLPINGSAIYIGNDRSFKEQSFSVGVTVQYECDYGHVVRGSWSSRLCQANGEWSGEPPVCQFVDCGTPPTIENGNYILKHPPAGSVGSATPIENIRRSDPGLSQPGTFTYYGTIAHYSCESNFKIQGPAQRECLESGQWRTPLPICEPVQCPKPEYFDEFTQVSLFSRNMTGSDLIGSDQQSAGRGIKLIANGQWVNTDLGSNYAVADRLHYSCVPGYELYGGPGVRTCTQYGQWSGSSTPRCRLIDCGKPTPIGQEGRYFLLNQSTTFNSLVEYTCVRPYKLVEQKIRLPGNLIETLTAAQAGVSQILTALPIGVKICANNGQWMPNDQLPKCVGASDSGQFEGIDNTLDSRQRIQVVPAPGLGSSNNQLNQLNDIASDTSSSQQHGSQAGQTSIWAKFVVAICLLVMLALIVLTVICIRSGRKPKQAPRPPVPVSRSSATNGHPRGASSGNAMQIQLANGMVNLKGHQQQQAVHQAAAAMLSNQNIYVNGSHHAKMFPNSMIAATQANHINHLNQVHLANQNLAFADANNQQLVVAANQGRSMVMVGGTEMLMNGKSSSLGIVGDRLRSGNGQGIELPMSVSSANMMNSYSRLSVESDQVDRNNQQLANAAGNKAIRHNPNGLITFVSPAQQQGRGNGSQLVNPANGSSQHQVSPQSISTSLSVSSSSSPSSSSSAHHTTATRLSTTDSASSSSSTASNQHSSGYQQAQPFLQTTSGQQQSSPPSLPEHPPPSHRLQQHHKQLLKQQQLMQQQQSNSVDPSQMQAASHHYMDPTL